MQRLLKQSEKFLSILNPSKINLYDSSRNDHERAKAIDEILALMEISKTEYEETINIWT